MWDAHLEHDLCSIVKALVRLAPMHDFDCQPAAQQAEPQVRIGSARSLHLELLTLQKNMVVVRH